MSEPSEVQVQGLTESAGAQDAPVRATRTRSSRIAKWLLTHILRHVRTGTLNVTFPDGTHFRAEGEAGPEATLALHNWRFVRRFFLKGDLAIAET